MPSYGTKGGGSKNPTFNLSFPHLFLFMAYFPLFFATRHEIDADLAQLKSFENRSISQVSEILKPFNAEMEELWERKQVNLEQNQQSSKPRVGFTFGHNVCWLFA